MADPEKAIKGLEHCAFGVSDTCYENDCPYYQSHDCTDELKNDILILLKEQGQTINELEEKLRLLEYGDQDILQSGMMPAT